MIVEIGDEDPRSDVAQPAPEAKVEVGSSDGDLGGTTAELEKVDLSIPVSDRDS